MTEREELAKQSAQALTEFVHNHPDYSVDGDQPEYRGGTNLITYGRLETDNGPQPIVFKYFIRTYRWSHEYYCLQHFADTGHVPQILAVVPKRLIVMTRLPDSDKTVMNLPQREQASHEIGQAIGDLARLPLPATDNWPRPQSEFEQFNWRTDVWTIGKEVLALCRQIQSKNPEYQTEFFDETLRLSEHHIGYIDQQPRILFHEDIPNLCVSPDGQLTCFYDLEMVRIGTEAHQLGVALDLCRPHWMEGEWLVWCSFVRGYQDRTGRTLNETDFLAILAMSHFYYHLRLSRWGDWDGDPQQSNHMDFALSNAEDYHTYMKRACYSLQEWVDLYKWFPSLR